MNNSQNLSLLIQSQLPEYIKSDPTYNNFVLFLQAYYEWMEQNGGALNGTKNILNYIDIDNTSNDFIKYFTNDFLQHFPEDALVDKSLAVKIARELYKSKGTLSSYKFLFRVLFNSDFDVFATKDAVLRASDGIWYVPQSLKLATTDPNFLDIQNLKIFGETSKSFAIIENSVLAGNKTEIFISNIERLFQSGEIVRILYGNNQDVLINGNPLRAKLVGQISQININPKNRGLLYKPGDPVIVYDGLNETTVNPIGATAEVGKTTTGSIQNINVTNGGFGYTLYPNTNIIIKNATGAIADVASVVSTLPPSYIITNAGTGYTINDPVVVGNTSSYFTFADVTAVSESGAITQITYRPGIDVNTIFGITANVISKNITAENASIKISSTAGNGLANATYIVTDTISLKTNEVHSGHQGGFLLGNTTNPVSYYFEKMPTANIKTKLSDAFSFDAFSTYSISSVIVQNGGGDISSLPVISAESTYITDVYDPNDVANTLGQNIQGKLSNLGILAPIQIVNPGIGYVVNDKIIFSGGSGYGAAANVTAVNATGGITAIDYVYQTSAITYSLGGMGYTPDMLPSVTVQSSNVSATGASVVVPGLLGYGATFSPTIDRVGSVTTINVLNYGEDYITTPNISLKVQDIVVSNVAITNLPEKNDIIYQGSTANTASYIAHVDTVSTLTSDVDPTKSLYNLRVFNYSTPPNPKLKLKVLDNEFISITMANSAYSADSFYPGSPEYNINGVKSYGDGTARATAAFLNGLTIGQGEYLSTQGQPSSFSVLQSELYNNYTYEIVVEKEIEKYRDILLNLLHPTGMKLLGKYLIKSNTAFDYHTQSALYQGKHLADYTGYIASNITMDADFVNYSTNIVKFNDIASSDISRFITPNSIISIQPATGNDIRSEINTVNTINNTVTLKNNVWLTFANVAYMSGNIGSDTLYVDSLTGTYDIINNGNYSNTQNHLEDVIFSGDRIKTNSIVYTVQSVDYTNKIITLTSNLTETVNNIVSINRTLHAGGTVSTKSQVTLFGPLGTQYLPELVTEDLRNLITEDGKLIIL